MGCSKSSSKRGVYSITILSEATKKISNKQPKVTPKAIREKEQKNLAETSQNKQKKTNLTCNIDAKNLQKYFKISPA